MSLRLSLFHRSCGRGVLLTVHILSQMNGGGTNDQMIPPEEGGDSRSQRPGTTSGAFEGEGQFGGQEEQLTERLRQNPGGFDAKPRGIDESRQSNMNEPVPRTTEQALEEDQEATARGHSYNS